MGNVLRINCNFSIPVDGLQENWSRLKAERDYILRTIAKSVEMSVGEQVNQWLLQVVMLELQVENLLANYPGESTNKCLCAFCPRNCNKSYGFREKMDQEVRNLLSKVPDVVVLRPQLIPTEPTTGMQVMLDEIWRYVENQQDDVRSIGICGMGGVGKTTLLKAVHNKLYSSPQIFDLQLWIVVSKCPNESDIQNYIGEKIGFRSNDWKTKSQQEKARDIYNVFCEKKYILLLDDLWEPFDLTKIGIPHPSPENKSKIIFTTRSLQVCHQMKAIQIHVHLLSEDEAWNLFQENVGEATLDAHHDIPGLAKEIMRKCNGLPLALIVIGRAMTSKTTVPDWEHAIQLLMRNTMEFSTITDEVFSPLKYSYHNLANDALRSCFLYCSLYAKHKEILKSDLVDIWICEDYLGRSDDLRNDRNKGHEYINNLVQASLLEECSSEKVRMHDVIRDMALWIGRDGFFAQARAGLTNILDYVNWEHVEKLSLMNNSIGELNVPTESIHLETVLLRDGGLSSINNDFFNFVPNLKVLDLSYNDDLQSLPKEFCELIFLKYLNLQHTSIKELPDGFQKLKKLQYLNVDHTETSTITEGVLSSMKELYVFRCGLKMSRIYDGDFLGENLVKEFEGLENLQDVAIPAASEVHISNLTSSVKLLNVITELTLTSFSDSTSLDILFLKEMKHLLCLNIENLEKVEKIVVGEEQGLVEISTIDTQNGLIINSTLRSLRLYGCSQLKNLSWVVFFPNIESIEVASCLEMQTLVSENDFGGDYELEQPFAKLQTLELSGMGKLESIYFTTLSFPCLNTLSVGKGCDSLKMLPFNSSSCDRGGGITIKAFNKWWNELQWEDKATRTTFSSCFKSMDG